MRRKLLLLIPLLVALMGCAVGSTAPTSVTPSATTPATGTISGDQLMYPASLIPPLQIYAISKTDSRVNFHVDTVQNQMTYSITGIAPGTYVVVAYRQGDSSGLAGGYSKAVPCGLSASCTDHSLIPVDVTAGGTVQNINPNDWYADPGTFPTKPS
jgi:hypothetical protein